MTNHTPGPWKFARSHEDEDGPMFELEEGDKLPAITRIYGAGGATVAAAHDLFEFKEADAQLIEAAPDMFKLLERAAESLRSHSPLDSDNNNLLADEVDKLLKKVQT